MRWVGIDEAGYGPNLGPLVMAAVVAESVDPDSDGLNPPRSFWDDLAATVGRARTSAGRFAVDDSKAVMKGRGGRASLLASCLALFDAEGRALPATPADLVASLPLRDSADAELERWLDAEGDPPLWPSPGWIETLRPRLARRPFAPASGAWRIAGARVEVVGPSRFNAGLARHPSKAGVHFEAFAALLRGVWDRARDGRRTFVRGDKHGGRHFYLGPLAEAFPEATIERGPEGPALSEYVMREGNRELTLRLSPRADAEDALAALASIAAKAARECWMDVFNAFWARRLPGLKPSAGYPVDASRFRRDVERTAADLGIEPRLWWRER